MVLTLGFPSGFAQLHHARVRIVADHAVDDHVLVLEEFFILLVVLDEAVFGVDRFHAVTTVAFAAQRAAVIDHHLHAGRIGHVLAAGTVASLALNAGFSPCAHDTEHIVLM